MKGLGLVIVLSCVYLSDYTVEIILTFQISIAVDPVRLARRNAFRANANTRATMYIFLRHCDPNGLPPYKFKATGSTPIWVGYRESKYHRRTGSLSESGLLQSTAHHRASSRARSSYRNCGAYRCTPKTRGRPFLTTPSYGSDASVELPHVMSKCERRCRDNT